MSNTLTNLIPDIYVALDVVSRELAGFIPSVTMDTRLERAALGEIIRSFVAPASFATDTVPGVTAPDTGDQNIGNRTMTISRSRHVPIRSSGEEQKGLNNGPGYKNILGNQFEQAFRTLTNEIETDLASLYVKASRAVTTLGTNLFDSTAKLGDFAYARMALANNGAPLGDLRAVIGTTEGAALRSLAPLTNVNESGSSTLLRQGIITEPLLGMAVRESAAVVSHVKGTGASATTDAAGYGVGSTSIGLASAGTGTLIAGDVITFTGDTNQYVVGTGDTNVANGGSLVINAPGLKIALPASAVAITVIDKPRRNMFFSRDAIYLATRPPAMPVEGDMADDHYMVSDPRSGLSFEIALYKQYKRVHYEVAIAWGYEVMNPEHLVTLIG